MHGSLGLSALTFDCSRSLACGDCLDSGGASLALIGVAIYQRRKSTWPNLKHPRDLNALAKSIVDEATGEVTPEPMENGKGPRSGRPGAQGWGSKGGPARAAKLTAEGTVRRRAEGGQRPGGAKSLEVANLGLRPVAVSPRFDTLRDMSNDPVHTALESEAHRWP